MLVVNTVAYCNLRLSLCGFVAYFWMQICGDKTIQFLTQHYTFANVVSLEGLRSAPMQCQKRFAVLRAQSSGCSICTAPQPWSMMMPITWQCGGQRCHQLLLINMEDKRILREWPTVLKIVKVWDGSRLQSEAGYWAAIHGPCFAGSSTICFYA